MSLRISEWASIVIGIVSRLLIRLRRLLVHGLYDFAELGQEALLERLGRVGFQDLLGFLIGPDRQVFFPLFLPALVGGPGEQLRRPVLLEMLERVLAGQVFAPGSHFVDEVQGQRLFAYLESSRDPPDP